MNDIEKALNDIALIKNVMNDSSNKLNGITLKAHLVVQLLALILVVGLVMIEYIGNATLTHTLLMGNIDDGIKNIGIALIATILTGLLCSLYFVVWRAAQHNGESVSNYIQRNFKYMNNMSFLSDLLMKFITVALVLLAGKAQWIAPLLMVFTADYLLQARFFTITTKVSSVLGIICIAVAIYMFLNGFSSILVPLVGFSIVCGISVVRLIIRFKKLTALTV